MRDDEIPREVRNPLTGAIMGVADAAPPPEFQETTEGIIPQVRRLNEEDRGRTPRRLTLREQNDQLRRELTRLQEDRALDRQPVVATGRPETPRETIERLRRTVQPPVQPEPLPVPPRGWWANEPPPVPPTGNTVHFTNVNDPEHWDDTNLTGIIGAEVAATRDLHHGNHGARITRIERGDMTDWLPKEKYAPIKPAEPDIMGKPEDHFL